MQVHGYCVPGNYTRSRGVGGVFRTREASPRSAYRAGATRETLGGVVSALLNQMWCRNTSYWSWRVNDGRACFGFRPGPIRASTEFVVVPGLIYWHSRCCFVESMTRVHVANLIGFCSPGGFLERQVLRYRRVA